MDNPCVFFNLNRSFSPTVLNQLLVLPSQTHLKETLSHHQPTCTKLAPSLPSRHTLVDITSLLPFFISLVKPVQVTTIPAYLLLNKRYSILFLQKIQQRTMLPRETNPFPFPQFVSKCCNRIRNSLFLWGAYSCMIYYIVVPEPH